MVAKKRASARVNPPVLTRPERLPLGDENLSWEQFEAFCREFVSEINDGARCRHYGKKGNRQHGIDLVCEVKSGEKYVYQCRQWKSFSKSKAELTIAQTAYKADRYFVLLSSEASADVQDIFLDNPKWDIYDVRDISMRVRRLSPQTSRRLIEQHFGADWIKGFLGRPKATSLLTVKQKFGKQLIDKAKLFNHGWKLVGRDDELKTLSAFLDDTRHAVCVLPGAGTIGKTKLLYEFSKKNECAHPYISFLSETFSPDELTDCEFDPLLVIVDDAHMRPDLDAFLSLMRRRTAWTKVILAVRPGALGKIRSSLSRADFDTSEIVQLPRLKKLKFDQTCELAHQSLASNVKSFDEVLARQTSDSPLITLVAGRLLSERQVTPQQLESDPDFYQTVMTRFTELITGDGLADWQRRLLQFIACLSPVPVRDDWFMERCAKALGLSKSQVAQAVADFIEHGAVQQRGRLIEITPDRKSVV